MRKSTVGFTLVEIMVVASIIAILATIMYANFNQGSAQSRDAERKADLRNIQSALELYKNLNGRYPSGCNGPDVWSGQIGTSYDCPTATDSQYIIGLAPKFIPVLPTDPKLNGVNSGYVYTTDDEGMVYKIMAMDTVESESVGYTHSFSRCGDVGKSSNECASVPTSPAVTFPYNTNGNVPAQCNTPATYENDYALVGGYANGGISGGSYLDTEIAREYFSDIVKCK